MKLTICFHPIIWFSLDLVNVFLQNRFWSLCAFGPDIIVIVPVYPLILRRIEIENYLE
jgi:hypothetical protein